ncbi:MAG TPA: hypothetical protein VHQ87_18510, partial [Rhizobacter sp.]|nr:hypothetical protein [Rhizobacter sp.]
VADLAASPAAAGSAAGGTPPINMHDAVRRPPLDPAVAANALTVLAGLEGILACAVVDSSTGLILARHSREDHPVQLGLAAAASTQVLRAHQQATRDMGLTTDIDEVMTSAGPRHHVMRTVSRRPGLFLFAVLDKQRTNLALARYKLMEAEQSLD